PRVGPVVVVTRARGRAPAARPPSGSRSRAPYAKDSRPRAEVRAHEPVGHGPHRGVQSDRHHAARAGHRRAAVVFRRLRDANTAVMRINLVLPMTVSFPPFPTRIVAERSRAPAPSGRRCSRSRPASASSGYVGFTFVAGAAHRGDSGAPRPGISPG